jgi:hypothetical protein
MTDIAAAGKQGTTSQGAAVTPPGLLATLVLTWVPFSLGIALVILLSIVADDVPHARAQYSVWLTLLLASGALFLFARDFLRRDLTPIWRLYWTFALAAYGFHLWYGYGVMFNADWGAVVASQDATTAYANLAITLLWLVDVICAWAGAKGTIVTVIRALAHAGVLAAGLLSTVLFFRDTTGAALGILMVLAVAAGVFERLRAK